MANMDFGDVFCWSSEVKTNAIDDVYAFDMDIASRPRLFVPVLKIDITFRTRVDRNC